MRIGLSLFRFAVPLSAGLMCVAIVGHAVSAQVPGLANQTGALSDEATAAGEKSPDASPAHVHPFRYELTPTRKVGKREKPDPLTLRFQLSPENAKPGDRVTLSITAVLEGKWHLYALTQNPKNYAKPTKIELEQLNGLKPVDDGFQPSKTPTKEDPFKDGKTQEVYYGEITWSRRYEVLPGAKAAGFGAAGQIRYQLCLNQCLLPIPVAFALGNLTQADAVPPPIDVGVEETVEQPATSSGETAQPLAGSGKSLWIYLFGCFGVGLAAVLTPCFYPMIPITVGFFLKQGEEQHARPLLLAGVYSLTIVVSFTAAGLVLGEALNRIGSGPVQNLIIWLLLVVFGMSLVGLFDIPIPQRLVRWSSQGEQKHQGRLLGVMFMALTLLIVGTPCIAPFWGPVLAGAKDVSGLRFGDVNFALAAGALSFSLALALPFFVLALAPGLVGTLPKSGGWMNTVKAVMGFLLLGLSLIFLVKADKGWQLGLLDRTGVLCLWAALAWVTSLYLLGLLRSAHDAPAQGVSGTRILLGTLCLAGALYLSSGLFQHLGTMEGYLPQGSPVLSAANAGGEELSWNEFTYDEAVAVAKKEGRPVFLDFTGASCTICQIIERTVFTLPDIRDRLQKMVLAKLYTDRDKPQDDKNYQVLGKRFGEESGGGVPFYVVVSPEGEILGRLSPQGTNIHKQFVRFLDQALTP